MDSLNKIAKGAGIVFLGMVLSKFFTYLNRIVIARIGAEEYGLFSISLAVFGILTMFSVIGLNEGVTRYVSHYKAKNDYSRVKGAITYSLKLGFCLSIALMLSLFIFSGWIASNIFHDSRIDLLLKILAIGLPFYTMREILFSAIKSYSLRIDYETVFRNILENFIKVFGTLSLVYLGLGVIGAAYANTSALIFTFIISFYVLERRVFPILKTAVISITEKQELLSYSLPIMFSVLLTQITVWTDTLMIGYFKTAQDVGIYNAALPSASLLGIFPQAMTALLLPLLCQLRSAGQDQEFRHTLRISTKWIFYLNLPVFLFLMLFSRQLLDLLFGPQYATAYTSLIILACGYLVYQFLNPVYETLKVLKKTNLLFVNTAVCALSNVLFNYLLIPRLGIVGGAIGTVLSLGIYSILSLIEITYLLKENIFSRYYTLSILSAIISWAATYRLMGYITSEFWQIMLGSASLSIIYLAGLLIFNCFENEDKRIIKTVISRFNLLRT